MLTCVEPKAPDSSKAPQDTLEFYFLTMGLALYHTFGA